MRVKKIYFIWFRQWLAACSVHLNQEWFIIICTIGGKCQWNLNQCKIIFTQENNLVNTICKIVPILFRSQCVNVQCPDPWWRNEMETFSALLALCARNSPDTGEFPAQRPVTRSFDAFFDLRLNKRLGKQSRRRWFEMPSRSLWRHCNARHAGRLT